MLSVYRPGAPGPGGARPLRCLTLDVFTETPLAGNPVAIVCDARELGAEQMQRVAREFNLSETVFVLPAQDGGDARIRIFTPSVEIPFAGHPVLGCAVAIALATGSTEVTLECTAGPVPVQLQPVGARSCLGRMRQPLPVWEPYEREGELLQALGVERSGLPIEAYVNGPRHVLVELAGEDAVASLRPDLGALAALGPVGVSCFAGSGPRWRTRMFAPAMGVPEDPATGSAAGPIAVHLARHGRSAFGEEIEIHQGAEIGRPSLLRARARGSAQELESVEVAGAALLVGEGELIAA